MMINLQDSLITELTKYYENFDKDSAEYIRQYFVLSSIELKNYIVKTCKETHPKKFGFPDISVLNKIYKNAPVLSATTFFSALRCNECQSMYAVDMMYCPVCWEKGKKQSAHSVVISDVPLLIINYNKKCANIDIEKEFARLRGKPVEPICYDCPEKSNSYCSHFGNVKYKCDNQSECSCYRCCAIAKRWIEEEYAKKGGRK